MEEALSRALADGAFLLGICVGYQLLFEAGEEHGRSDGLGLLPGVVERLPQSTSGARIALPHIGWNRLHDESDHPLLDGIPRGSYFYFVHSYAPLAAGDGEHQAALHRLGRAQALPRLVHDQHGDG